MFPSCRDYGLPVRVFLFSAHEATIATDEVFEHGNYKDEKPLAAMT